MRAVFFLLGLCILSAAAFASERRCANSRSISGFGGELRSVSAFVPERHINLEIFKRDHLFIDQIEAKDNHQFMELVDDHFAKFENGHAQITNEKKKLFFDLDNVILKQLNDSVFKEKDLGTAVTNLHKKILLAHLKEKEFEILRNHLIAKYSDYKSLRLAFDEDTPELRKALKNLYEKAAKSFKRNVQYKELYEFYAREGNRGIVLDPDSWHLAGVGNTADEAGIAGRFARKTYHPGAPTSLLEFDQITDDVKKEIALAESKRKFLSEKIHHPLIMGHNNEDKEFKVSGEKFLSPDAIEILRKVKAPDLDSYREVVRQRFSGRFNVELSNEVIDVMNEYYTTVDRFSAGIMIEKREVIDQGLASHGVVSVDFAGQGAKNHFLTQTALTIAAQKGVYTDVPHLSRKAEKIATKKLDERKKISREILSEMLPNEEIRLFFSGDDGVMFPSETFTDEHKVQFVQKMAERESGDISHYRITFLSQNFKSGKEIPKYERSRWIVKAEEVEKQLRIELEGKIPFEILKQLIMAIDLQPLESLGPNLKEKNKESSKGTVNLFLGEPNAPEFRDGSILYKTQAAFKKMQQMEDFSGLTLGKIVTVPHSVSHSPAQTKSHSSQTKTELWDWRMIFPRAHHVFSQLRN